MTTTCFDDDAVATIDSRFGRFTHAAIESYDSDSRNAVTLHLLPFRWEGTEGADAEAVQLRFASLQDFETTHAAIRTMTESDPEIATLTIRRNAGPDSPGQYSVAIASERHGHVIEFDCGKIAITV